MTTKPRTLHEAKAGVFRAFGPTPGRTQAVYDALDDLITVVRAEAALLEAVPHLDDQEKNDHGASLLPADPSAPPATTEALPNDATDDGDCPSCGYAYYGPPALCTCGTCAVDEDEQESASQQLGALVEALREVGSTTQDSSAERALQRTGALAQKAHSHIPGDDGRAFVQAYLDRFVEAGTEPRLNTKGRHTFTYTVSRFEDAKRLALKCAIAGQVAIAEGDARTISKGELLLEAAKTIEALVALADGNQASTQPSGDNRGSAAQKDSSNSSINLLPPPTEE